MLDAPLRGKPLHAPRLAREFAGRAGQHLGLRIAKQRHELRAVGDLRIARIGGVAAEQRIDHRARAVGTFEVPGREQRVEVFEFLGQRDGLERAFGRFLRIGQRLVLQRSRAVALEFGFGHVEQFVLRQRGERCGHADGPVHQRVQVGRGLQPALHVGAGDAGGAQRHALAVHLLQRSIELAGHGEQPRLRLPHAARGTFQRNVAMRVGDDGGDRFGGPVDQRGRAVVALAGFAQTEFRAAGDRIGKLAMQTRKLRVQQFDLTGFDRAEQVGTHDLAEQGGELRAVVVLGITGCGLVRQRCEHRSHALGDGRQTVAALAFVPDQQTHVAKSLEHGLQCLGAQRVEQLVDVFAWQLRIALRRELQKHPDAQLHQRRIAVEQAAQGMGELGLAGEIPQQR